MNDLYKLIIEARKKATEITYKLTEGNNSFRGLNTDVVSISDTIAIFTPGTAELAIQIHGELCKYLILESIIRGIPLRGATSYCAYSRQENIMIGSAIDESASWHESTNWMGVILSPSAIFELRGNVPNPWIKYPAIPFKKKISLQYCIEWNIAKNDLMDNFKNRGPFIPEIAEKYVNTNDFIEWQETQNK